MRLLHKVHQEIQSNSFLVYPRKLEKAGEERILWVMANHINKSFAYTGGIKYCNEFEVREALGV